MKNEDLYWLAGWLEGEGSFIGKTSRGQTKCTIQAACTDEDIIVRVASILGTPHRKVNRRKNGKDYWKDVYSTALHGLPAKELMIKLKPLMGNRRQIQIQKAVDSYQPSEHKFTKEIIEEIKSLSGKISQEDIGKKFNTDRTTINKIINNKYNQ